MEQMRAGIGQGGVAQGSHGLAVEGLAALVVADVVAGEGLGGRPGQGAGQLLVRVGGGLPGHRRWGHLLALDELDLGYRVVAAQP